MKRLPRLAFLAISLLATPVLAAPEIGKPAPDFTAPDINGAAVTLSALKGKTVVVEWTNPGCPFVVKHYKPGHMQKLQADATAKGVVWISINSSASGKEGHLDATAAKALVAENKSAASHLILDADGTIGRLYEAKTTPHMFVIDTKGTLAYMGAIDDKASVDSADIAGARNYVTDALSALAAGKVPDVANTKPYGCGVKY